MTTQVEKQVSGSGQGLTWAAAFGTEIQGLTANNTAVLSSIVIDNSAVLDMYADLSLVFTGTAGSSYGAGAYMWSFLYPLNRDLSTYGDGRFTVAASGLPSPPRQYYSGGLAFVAGGPTTPQTGVIPGILLPPGKFKFVAWNPLSPGVIPNWPPSGVNIYYRTYNRAVQ